MAKDWFTRLPSGRPGGAVELDTSVAHPARVYDYWLGPVRQTRRTRTEFARFFEGLDLVEPGVVPLLRALASPSQTIPAYAAVGRKR